MATLERFTHRLRGLPDEEDEFEPSDEGDAEATFVDAFVPLIKNCHRIFISNESDWLLSADRNREKTAAAAVMCLL